MAGAHAARAGQAAPANLGQDHCWLQQDEGSRRRRAEVSQEWQEGDLMAVYDCIIFRLSRSEVQETTQRSYADLRLFLCSTRTHTK